MHAPHPAPARSCTLCRDTGWADPWDAHDGSPTLTWCDECLGAGLDDCGTCDGYGAVPEPTPCPRCETAGAILAA